MKSLRSHERGAALIVAILVMLVLSALGLVAMKSANESNWVAGTHRIGAQSSSFSDSVTQYALMRSGLRAASLHELLRRRTNIALATETAVSGDENASLRRGGYQFFVLEQAPTGGQVSLYDELGAEGLLSSETLKGVEADPTLNPYFQYVVRDPVQGPRAPGYGDQFCFTRVTIASEARFVRGNHTSRRRQLRSMSRHAADAFIGPVECGAR